MMRHCLYIILAFSLVALPGCRPRPSEGEIGTFVATTPDDETGLYSLTAAEGSISTLSEVIIVNSNTDERSSLFSDLNGAFFAELTGSVGDVLSISYSDPEGIFSVATIVLPLQRIRYDGTLYYDGGCLEFEREDISDEDPQDSPLRYELVGPVADLLTADLSPGDSITGTLFGEPILLGFSDCDLPLLELAQLRPQGLEPPIFGIHGRHVEVQGDDGETCQAFDVTAPLPFDVFYPPDETQVEERVVPVDAQGEPVLVPGSSGRWHSLEMKGDFMADTGLRLCGLRGVVATRGWFDEGERRDLQGTITIFGEGPGACIRLEGNGGQRMELVGPLHPLLTERPPPSADVPVAVYRVETPSGAPAEEGECGLPFILAGLSGQGGPPPDQGEPSP